MAAAVVWPFFFFTVSSPNMRQIHEARIHFPDKGAQTMRCCRLQCGSGDEETNTRGVFPALKPPTNKWRYILHPTHSTKKEKEGPSMKF